MASNPGATGWVDVESLTTGQVFRIAVISALHDVNCDGRTNAVDALLILQLVAGVIDSVACVQNGDVNGDGTINPLDAVLILQLEAGIIDSVPRPTPTATAAPSPTAGP
jgi:hypothetical protein